MGLEKMVSSRYAISIALISASVAFFLTFVSVSPTRIKAGDTITAVCTIGKIDSLDDGVLVSSFDRIGTFAIAKVIRDKKLLRKVSQEENITCFFENRLSGFSLMECKSIQLDGDVKKVERENIRGHKFTRLTITVRNFSD